MSFRPPPLRLGTTVTILPAASWRILDDGGTSGTLSQVPDSASRRMIGLTRTLRQATSVSEDTEREHVAERRHESLR